MIQVDGSQLSQWDVGRSVSVSDSNATHVHFANQGDSKAVIIEIAEGSAKIPDYLLQTGRTLLAYAVLNGVTMESKSFAVRKRERPENYVYEDDQRNYIYELIKSAEEATASAEKVSAELLEAKANGEFDGPAGPQGPKGEKGDPGSVAFEDLTEEQVASLKGDPGEAGRDGVSPTHSWNGTVLSITSASGTSSADLKGEKGDRGEKGDQGIQGATGAQGAKGDKGDKGEKGDTGAQGVQGVQGAKGETGADGITPHIGSNGNWFIGTTDTGVSAGGGSGVSALIVTMSEDSIASHTPAQILAHMQNGGVVYLNPYENDFVQCTECDGYNAIFSVMYDDYTGYTYVIDENGICNQSENIYASFQDVPTTLVVTLYEDGATADYGSARIYEHIQNGGIVYLKPYDGDYIPCSDCTEDIAYFTSVLDGYVSVSYRIFADRTVARDDQYYAKKSDIPTALPNPHALTLTGAVSATYDGSKAVSIEIPSGGGSGGGGSGGASYSWQTEPTTEEVTEIVYTLGNTIDLANKIVNADSMRLYVYLVAPAAESTDATESGSVNAGIYINSFTWGWQAVNGLKVAPVPSVSWSLTAEIESVLLQAGKKINDIAALTGWVKRSGIMLTTGYPKNKNPITTTPFISGCGINKNAGNGMREIALKVTSTTPLGVGSYMRLECYNSSGV